MFYFWNKATSPNTDNSNPAIETWEDDGTSGDADNIIIQTTAETMPPSEILPDESDKLEEPEISEEVSTIEPIESEPTEMTENIQSVDSYALNFGDEKLVTAIDWNLITPTSNDGNTLTYSFAGCDVSLSILNGNKESIRELVNNKAIKLEAELTEEYINYTSSRVTDFVAEYDKYTLQYNDSYIYYFVSEITSTDVYLITVETSDPILTDDDFYGALEYSIK